MALRPATGDVIVRHKDRQNKTYKNGLLHSYDNQPAVINGKYHVWYENGEIHRGDDKPAVINGYYHAWYVYGVLHRDNGPALIEGTRHVWYTHNQFIKKRIHITL